jgi:hypothetical protein
MSQPQTPSSSCAVGAARRAFLFATGRFAFLEILATVTLLALPGVQAGRLQLRRHVPAKAADNSLKSHEALN